MKQVVHFCGKYFNQTFLSAPIVTAIIVSYHAIQPFDWLISSKYHTIFAVVTGLSNSQAISTVPPAGIGMQASLHRVLN